MTSGDISTIEFLLREHFARTDKQLSDMRADNAEFRAEMVRLHNDFAEKQNAKFDAFTQNTDAKMTAMQEQIAVMQNDITGLKHDVAGLYHWDYWLLSIILVLFAMPQIVAGVKSLFGAFADGISLIVKAFRK